MLLTAGASVIADIFEQVGNGVTSFFGVLKNVLENIVDLIWVSGTGMTTFGILSVCGIGVGLVYGAFKLIRGLTRSAA